MLYYQRVGTAQRADGCEEIDARGRTSSRVTLRARAAPRTPRRCSGTQGDDVCEGEGGNDLFEPKGGDDIARGGDGNDQVYGRKGDDKLCGDDGNDHVEGCARRRRRCDGGDGNDNLIGGYGEDELDGGSGNDRLNAGWGEPRRGHVDCGPGSDTAVLGPQRHAPSTARSRSGWRA